MNNLGAIALSGLQAAKTRLNVSANNVANAQTEGFRPSTVQTRAQTGGGVQTTVQTADTPQVDWVAERVEQISATYAFKANLQSLRVDDDTLGRLLNARA